MPLKEHFPLPKADSRLKINLSKLIPRGFEPKPNRLYQAIYITRQRRARPDEPNTLRLGQDDSGFVYAEILRQTIKIPKDCVTPAVYSGAYIRSFNIDQHNCDYAITRDGHFSHALQNLSGVVIDYNYVRKSVERCESHILVAKRLNIVAPGTTHLAFYSDHRLVSPNTFYSIICDEEQAEVLASWINSVFGILQFLQERKETEGGYCDLLKEDFVDFEVPRISSMPEQVENAFEKLAKIHYPSLSSQFKADSGRKDLDRAWMSWLGWPNDEIEKDLSEIYTAIDKELKAISTAGKRTRIDRSQTTMLDSQSKAGAENLTKPSPWFC